jgi:hypothetical protein
MVHKYLQIICLFECNILILRQPQKSSNSLVSEHGFKWAPHAINKIPSADLACSLLWMYCTVWIGFVSFFSICFHSYIFTSLLFFSKTQYCFLNFGWEVLPFDIKYFFLQYENNLSPSLGWACCQIYAQNIFWYHKFKKKIINDILTYFKKEDTFCKIHV